MQVQNIQNNNYNSTTFNACIKGTDFSKKDLLSDILKQAPFDKCNEVFTVSKSNHVFNVHNGYVEKAYVAIRKIYHNVKGVTRSKQPYIKGIPISAPDSEKRDSAIVESIIKYLSEVSDTIPKKAFDDVCKKLEINHVDEISSTESRILEYTEDSFSGISHFYRKSWEM